MFYKNHASYFSTGYQGLRVSVRDPVTNAVRQTLFGTGPASPPQIAMTHFSRDISSFAGQRVRIDIEMDVHSFYFDAGFDNFKIEGGTSDTTTLVTASVNPSTYGQAVVFAAAVAVVPPGTGTPTGAVQFEIDGAAFGAPVALSEGSATSSSIATLAAGNHTITAVYSGDSNYNGSSASLTQNVQYRFSGFLSPIGDRNSRAGSTIPIKWQLTDAAGNFISDLNAVQGLLVGPVGGAFVAPGASGKTSLRYDIADNQFIFNWQTKGLSAGDYAISLTLSDGMTYTATVTLK